jgi:hypothetical protein
MNKLEIIQIIALALIILGLTIYYICKAIKNKWIEKLTDTIKKAIQDAETKFPEGHGQEKLELVLEAVRIKCAELGIPYEMLYKLIRKLVNKIIENYNIIAKK